MLSAAAVEAHVERRAPRFRALLISLALLGGGLGLSGCDYPYVWRHQRAVGACPRPEVPTGAQPQFNDQQRQIRFQRQRAFSGDFFAQLELAQRYQGWRANDKNLEDPVEAATWYAIALSNPSGYEELASRGEARGSPRRRLIGHFDDCRAFERAEAYGQLNRLLSRMDTGEWESVRKRIIYVLASQGADGFRTLGRIYDTAFGPFGEPMDDNQARYALGAPDRPGLPSVLQLFPRNDVDAYLYDDLAAQAGDVGGYVLMKDFERSSPQRASFAGFVDAKVNRWVPPYEFYPPEAPGSGVPHSDESEPRGEVAEAALARIDELPFVHILDALAYLGVVPRDCPRNQPLTPSGAKAFQAMIGQEQTGWLTPLEKLRVIQYAAVNGSPKAQLALAVMYADGVGVATDYARAFYWFERADKEGSPEAKYAISTYFSLGVAGVADQDKAKAVVYQIDAALSGFKPSADRLQAMLARMSGAPRSNSEGEHW